MLPWSWCTRALRISSTLLQIHSAANARRSTSRCGDWEARRQRTTRTVRVCRLLDAQVVRRPCLERFPLALTRASRNLFPNDGSLGGPHKIASCPASGRTRASRGRRLSLPIALDAWCWPGMVGGGRGWRAFPEGSNSHRAHQHSYVVERFDGRHPELHEPRWGRAVTWGEWQG